MNYATFLRDAERGQPPPVALIHGADVQLLDDALAAATRGLFPDPTLAVFGREVLDGRDTAVEAIVRSATMMPLMTAARLVAVRHGQALSPKGSDALARYVTDPNPSTCLLLLADEPLGGSRERKAEHWLLRTVPPAAVMETPLRRGRALEDWLRQRAAAEGVTVSEDAARVLVEWVGDESAALLGEVRKAALTGGAANNRVGLAEVRAVVGEHRLRGVFDLARAVERRDVALALATLDRLLATEEPTQMLGLLARELRTAWTVREARERGQSVEQIAQALRRPPSAIAALGAYADGPADRLSQKLQRCWEVERRLKSGGEPRAELAALVAELCDPR